MEYSIGQKRPVKYTMDLANSRIKRDHHSIKDNSIEYQLDELIKRGIDAVNGYRRDQSIILVTLKGLEIY